MVAIGKVVFTSREHIIALEPRGKGLLGITLRYPYEVRNEADYFDDIPDEKIPKDMLDLASHISCLQQWVVREAVQHQDRRIGFLPLPVDPSQMAMTFAPRALPAH